MTKQQYDVARTDYEAKKARYETLARQRSATSSAADVSRQRISQSEAGIELAKAMVDIAKLNLSYTVIVSPCDGYTSRTRLFHLTLMLQCATVNQVVICGSYAMAVLISFWIKGLMAFN